MYIQSWVPTSVLACWRASGLKSLHRHIFNEQLSWRKQNESTVQVLFLFFSIVQRGGNGCEENPGTQQQPFTCEKQISDRSWTDETMILPRGSHSCASIKKARQRNEEKGQACLTNGTSRNIVACLPPPPDEITFFAHHCRNNSLAYVRILY